MPNSASPVRRHWQRRLLWAGATVVALSLLAPANAHAEPSSDLDRRIQRQSDQLEIVIERYHDLREDLRVTAAQTGVLKRQVEPLRQQIKQRRAAVGRLAVASYRAQRTSSLNLLLDATTTRQVVDRMLLLQAFAKRKQQEIDALALTSARYEAARRTLDALILQQRDQQKQLTAERLTIETSIADLKALRTRAYGAKGRVTRTSGRETVVLPKLSGANATILSFAMDQIGKNYRFAAEGPNAFDCSGLVTAAFRTVGVILPHHAGRQQRRTKQIARGQLLPGDLVFFYRDLHHVGIYLGGNKMVHAPQYGEQVRVDSIDSYPIHSFGRVVDSAPAGATARRKAATRAPSPARRVPSPASPPGKK